MPKKPSKGGNFLVATLQLKIKPTYHKNLTELMHHILNSRANLIVAPELCLTDFDYQNFEEAAQFYDVALKKLLDLVPEKIIILTMIKKIDNHFVNQALVLYDNKMIKSQNKYKLFKLGNEEQYFIAGKKEDIVKFKINSVNYAILICFELRFKELWARVEGADIVVVPARWGITRKKHLETLSQALAIMNQVFVLVSNASDEDMASSSAIISPWGEVLMDDTLELIEKCIDLKELKKVRRLIVMK